MLLIIRIHYLGYFSQNTKQTKDIIVMNKSLKQRIKQAKSLTIQKLQSTIDHKMVLMYFKQNLVYDYIQRFGVVAKDGIIKVTFKDAQNARRFVKHSNFKDKILLRPFNIYFNNIQAKQHEKQDFKIMGVTQQNQRKIYQISSKYGLVKLNTNYVKGYEGMLLKQAVLSILRQDQLTQKEEQRFKKQLNQIQVELIPRKHKKDQHPQIKMLSICKQKINQIYTESLQVLRQFQQKILKQITKRRNQLLEQFKNIQNSLTFKTVQDISMYLQSNNKKDQKSQNKSQLKKIGQRAQEFVKNMEKTKSLFQYILTDQLLKSEEYINQQLGDMNKFIFSLFNKQFGFQKKKQENKEQKELIIKKQLNQLKLQQKQPQPQQKQKPKPLFEYKQQYQSEPQYSDDGDLQFEYDEEQGQQYDGEVDIQDQDDYDDQY